MSTDGRRINPNKGARMKQFRSGYEQVRGKTADRSWDEIVDSYIFLKETEGASVNTISSNRNYAKLLRKFIELKYPGASLRDITVDVARIFIHYMMREHVKHANNAFKRDEAKEAGDRKSVV